MADTLTPLFETIEGLEPLQRDALIRRYAEVLRELRTKRRRIACQYHALRVTSTLGSLLIPALLSAQYASGVGIQNEVAFFWITWTISFLVTFSNGMLTMFKIDKQYVSFQAAFEQLYSEGWQYIQLGGRYSHGKKTPTHANQLLRFIHRIETIQLHTVEEEFVRIQESESGGAGATAATATHDDSTHTGTSNKTLIPPSPMTASSRTRKARRQQRLAQQQPTATLPRRQDSVRSSDADDDAIIIQVD
jgi:Protein of unknown function (DUF4231)